MAYLEGLRIPVLDLFDRRHLAEAIRQLPQVLNPVRETDGEFLGEKLRCTEKSAWNSSEIQATRRWFRQARGKLPVDGRSPNWTICLSDTPVAGKLA